MKPKTEYDLLIKAARNRSLDTIYKEKHHVLPKSMGGTDTVLLTLKEHFISHQLLEKITRNTKDHWKMVSALKLMCETKDRLHKIVVPDDYVKLKSKWITAMNSKELRKKRSDAAIKRWQNPEYREKMIKHLRNLNLNNKKNWEKGLVAAQQKLKENPCMRGKCNKNMKKIKINVSLDLEISILAKNNKHAYEKFHKFSGDDLSNIFKIRTTPRPGTITKPPIDVKIIGK